MSKRSALKCGDRSVDTISKGHFPTDIFSVDLIGQLVEAVKRIVDALSDKDELKRKLSALALDKDEIVRRTGSELLKKTFLFPRAVVSRPATTESTTTEHPEAK